VILLLIILALIVVVVAVALVILLGLVVKTGIHLQSVVSTLVLESVLVLVNLIGVIIVMMLSPVVVTFLVSLLEITESVIHGLLVVLLILKDLVVVHSIDGFLDHFLGLLETILVALGIIISLLGKVSSGSLDFLIIIRVI